MFQLNEKNVYKYIVLFIIIYVINKFTKNTILEYKKSVIKKQEELNKINNDLEKILQFKNN